MAFKHGESTLMLEPDDDGTCWPLGASLEDRHVPKVEGRPDDSPTHGSTKMLTATVADMLAAADETAFRNGREHWTAALRSDRCCRAISVAGQRSWSSLKALPPITRTEARMPPSTRTRVTIRAITAPVECIMSDIACLPVPSNATPDRVG